MESMSRMRSKKIMSSISLNNMCECACACVVIGELSIDGKYVWSAKSKNNDWHQLMKYLVG
jgi:hypothetical protein